MLDVDKFSYTTMTKREYRKHLLELIETAQKTPITTIEQGLEAQQLLLSLAKELYKLDKDGD